MIDTWRASDATNEFVFASSDECKGGKNRRIPARILA